MKLPPHLVWPLLLVLMRPLPAQAAHANPTTNVVRVGVIGAGRIGLVHLDALNACPTAKPLIISNPTLQKAKNAADQYPGVQYTDDENQVINHPDVDAVWICSPSQFHADQITACANAGKHIFCEKPLATELDETIKAVSLCREKKVKLMTALQRRFDPNFARVKKSIENGDIGELVCVKLCSRDPAPPPFNYVKGGGGIFKDMAVHDLDMARYLMGSEPIAVLASGSCQVSPEIKQLEGPEAFDTASIIVKFANGKEAIIDVCRQAPYGYDQRAEVLGTKGMIMTDNMHPSTARIFTEEFVGHADLPYNFFMSRYKEAYKLETMAFVDALNADLPAPCSGRDGLVALIMAIAAGISSQEERWVRFEEVLQREEIGGLHAPLAVEEDGTDGSGWVKNALRGIKVRDPSSSADLEELFYLFDNDDDGKLSVRQVIDAIHLLCEDGACPNFSGDEIQAMVKKVDTDGDGQISFDEFLVMWREAGNSVEGEGASSVREGVGKFLGSFFSRAA